MESEIHLLGRYRPVFKFLRVGSKEYAVLEPDAACERVQRHLSHVQRLLLVSPYSDEINKELILATDFGSMDAPFLLAQRILDPAINTPYHAEEIVLFLKLAAERGHVIAAYHLGSSYAGLGRFKRIEMLAKDYFNDFSPEERVRLGEYYLNLAIEANNQDAIEDLVIAYAYGRGLVPKNAEQFVGLCETQVKRGNQAVQLGYGAWLCGMTVEGEEPLETSIQIGLEYGKGAELLLLAARGKNLKLAQHALHLICIGLLQGRLSADKKKQVRQRLIQDALRGNQLLALYLGWYSIPIVSRSLMPKVLEMYQLTQLASVVDQYEENAIAYLDKAIFGHDEDIAACAREVMSHVFGKCFLNDDGMIVLGRQEYQEGVA